MAGATAVNAALLALPTGDIAKAGEVAKVGAGEVTSELKASSGRTRALAEGATPNSIYTQISADGKVAVQNSIYDADGLIKYQVDFKNHGGGATSGHGHMMETPGVINSGHKHTSGGFTPHEGVPAAYKSIPEGTQPSKSIGQ